MTYPGGLDSSMCSRPQDCMLRPWGAHFLRAARSPGPQKGPEARNLGAKRDTSQGRSQPRQAAQAQRELAESPSTEVSTRAEALEPQTRTAARPSTLDYYNYKRTEM